jgi:hypothetical protein
MPQAVDPGICLFFRPQVTKSCKLPLIYSGRLNLKTVGYPYSIGEDTKRNPRPSMEFGYCRLESYRFVHCQIPHPRVHRRMMRAFGAFGVFENSAGRNGIAHVYFKTLCSSC